MKKRILKRKYLLLILLLIGYGIYFFSQITLESHLPLAEQPRVAAILGAEDNVFWKLIWQSVLEEAANQEMLLSRYPLPDNSSLSDAYDALETAEIADVDGVLLYQSRTPDEAYYQLLEQLREKDTKIITIASDLLDSYADVFIGMDNEQVGSELARSFLQYYDEGSILLLSYEGTMSKDLEVRLASVTQVLEDEGLNDKIVQLKLPSGMENIIEKLQSYFLQMEGPVWVISIATQQTLYAARTIVGLDLQERFHLIGFGETAEAMRYVQEGAIDLLAIQDTQQEGKRAIQIMGELLDGEMAEITHEYVQAAILDKNTVADYLELYQAAE